MAAREALPGENTGQLERALVRHLETNLDRSYALAAVILGNSSEAEEATHDAVLAAWRGLDRLRDPQRMEAWFTRILVNACRDRLRRRRVRPLEVELPEALPAPSGTADSGALDELSRMLDGLSPEHRAVVALRFWATSRSRRSPRGPASGRAPSSRASTTRSRTSR